MLSAIPIWVGSTGRLKISRTIPRTSLWFAHALISHNTALLSLNTTMMIFQRLKKSSSLILKLWFLEWKCIVLCTGLLLTFISCLLTLNVILLHSCLWYSDIVLNFIHTAFSKWELWRDFYIYYFCCSLSRFIFVILITKTCFHGFSFPCSSLLNNFHCIFLSILAK